MRSATAVAPYASAAAGCRKGDNWTWAAPPRDRRHSVPPVMRDQMNQLCRVCGEPAAGFHFGAFTCEGCKSFFGRTYSNLSSISECKNNGECVINKKNRTSCKACRLRKCLLVGMSKSGSRYGRRSNWFKIHCLLQERQQQQQLQQHQHVAAAAAGSAGASQCPSPVTVQRDAKSNSSPAWAAKAAGERDGSKNFHLEAKRLAAGSPPRVSAPQLPSQHLSLPGYPGDAAASAAAFWAQARGSLLQLPTPHLSGLPVPFLTPPFLHSTGFHPYQHKNFLLPFLPADSAAVRPPRQPSPAASCIHSPLLGCGRRSASSGGCSSDGVSPLPSPPAPPATAPPSVAALPLVPPSQPLPPPPVSTAAAAAAAALVVETLRSLGPMQERPLDLSVKGAGYGNPSRILNSKRSSESESECEDDQESEDDDQQADDEVFMAMAQDGKDAPGQSGVPEGAAMRRTTPLDLTTRA